MLDAIFRIGVGILLIVVGGGWTLLCSFAAAMADSPNDRDANVQALIGLVVAAFGVGVLCLPIFIH